MKKFKTKSNKNRRVDLIIIIIIVLILIFLHYYDIRMNKALIDYSASKLEEITTLYIKKDIAPKNVELNNLISVNLNKNEEITYIDIDMDYAREIMVQIVKKIQSNIFRLENGKIEDFNNSNELKSKKGILYMEIPLLINKNKSILSSIGPKVPIKLSFYEHVLGNVETKITEYGINNALINVYMIITLEQKLYLPYKEEKLSRDYSIILGSKIVTGKVPSIYGDGYKKTSSIIEM